MLPSLPSSQFDVARRRQLLAFLSALNVGDWTTSDNFWLDIFRKFDGSRLEELLKPVINAKVNSLSLKLGLAVKPRTYQIELFERLSHDHSNYIVFLPTGAGKTLVSYLLMKHMLEQYSDLHVLFLAKSVALAGQQYLSFLKLTNFPQEATNLFYGGKTSKGKSLKPYRAFFMTPVVYQQMLDAGELKIHHCSLLVFDEVHHARKEDPYAVLMRDYVLKELPSHRPRVLGMTASPGEGRSVSESMESIQSLCQTMTASLTTPTLPQSMADLEDCTAHQELIIDEYQPGSSDSRVLHILDDFLKATMSILLSMEVQSGLDSNQNMMAQSDNIFIDGESDDLPMRNGSRGTSRSEAIKALELTWAVLEEEARNATRQDFEPFFEALRAAIQVTTAGANKLMLVGLLKTLGVREHVEDFGLSSAKALAADISDPIPDGILYMSNSGSFRHHLMQWNEKKKALRVGLNDCFQGAVSGHGKMEPLMKHLKSMAPDSRAIVFVLERATAKKVTAFLQANLPPSVGADCLVGKADMSSSRQLTAAQRFNTGEFKVLVATSVAEEGIDIKSCDLVVRLDGTMTAKALIQSRGRARSHDSRFVLIVAPEERKHLNFLIKKEKFMLAAVRSQVDPSSVIRDGIDLNALFAEFSDSSEATTTDPAMFNALHQWYQQKQMPFPEFYYTDTTIPGPARFTASVTCQRRTFTGVGEKKKDAKFRAAIPAYQYVMGGPSPSPSSSTLIGRLTKTAYSNNSSGSDEETFYDASSSDSNNEIIKLLRAASLSPNQSQGSHGATVALLNDTDPLEGFIFGKSTFSPPSSHLASSSSSAPLATSSTFSSPSQRGKIPATLAGRVRKEHLSSADSVSVLQVICQQNRFPLPEYADSGQDSFSGQFVANCTAFEITVSGKGANKKLAKHAAALAMLQALHKS